MVHAPDASRQPTLSMKYAWVLNRPILPRGFNRRIKPPLAKMVQAKQAACYLTGNESAAHSPECLAANCNR
ncbi:hypothetical protein [Bartonella apis]|uniref:hypothetical protein n=1 Tax=Bartonella apis TaxID=1686310 RepID=UPI00242B2D27|nr:hypothetical protein [Bartonella apis]